MKLFICAHKIETDVPVTVTTGLCSVLPYSVTLQWTRASAQPSVLKHFTVSDSDCCEG